MATIKAIIPIVLLLLFGDSVPPDSLAGNRGSEAQRSYYAAVFLNRGHVSGGVVSNIGLFRRSAGDTAWSNIYRRNLFTFGLGLWKSGSTTRQYIAAGNGLHRSVDGRKTWRVLTDWRTEEVLSVALDPVDSAVIYIATPFGVFRSTDDGARWQKKMAGMNNWFVKKVIVDWSDRSALFAGAEDDLYRSTDKGEHWTPLRVGVPGMEAVVQHPADPKHLLVGTSDDGVRVSVDGGKSWKEGKGLPNTAFYAVCVSSDKQTIYAGGYQTGLWKSDDGGLSWALLWQNSEIEAIYVIFVHPDDPRHLMVGTSGQGIYESRDGGKAWSNIGLKGCHVKQIELYP
jgi:photosystem II stability/assembly factor-like uncharacterized protein